jgi:phosphatidylglycerophosphate synthase
LYIWLNEEYSDGRALKYAQFNNMVESQEHPVLSKLPNVLGFGRMAFGVYQAVDLHRTPPEERTRTDAIETAGAAVTDKLDGFLTELYGSTKHGPTIDRLADVIFSVGGEVSLALNGEISPIHPLSSIGREVTVNTMRRSAVAHGRPAIEVSDRGRQKTTMKMAMMTMARSPLSRREGIVESMASFGSALSIMSGVEYGLQGYKSTKDKPRSRDLASSARNGSIRQATDSPNARIVRFIHEKAPRVMPDHLTKLGEGLVEVSVIATLIKPEWGVAIAAIPYTFGGIIDGWDGNLARLLRLNSLAGMLKDVQADKRQEIFTAAGNSLLASRRGNTVAASQYAIAAATATLPALLRATAESRGHIVSEDASGSRVIRGIEGGIGLGLNKHAGIGNTVSALMVAGNLITAAQRADVALRGSASPHYRGANNKPKFRAEARARRNTLLPVSIGGIAVGAVLLMKERARRRRANSSDYELSVTIQEPLTQHVE